MPSTARDRHPGKGPGVGANLWAMAAMAVVIAYLVIVYAPAAPVPTEPTVATDPAGCSRGDDLCRAVHLLEQLQHDPSLTPAEREAVDTARQGVDEIINPPAATLPALPPPPPATSTSTTSTTTTLPPSPPATVPRLTRQQWIDRLTDQLGLDVTPTTVTG